MTAQDCSSQTLMPGDDFGVLAGSEFRQIPIAAIAAAIPWDNEYIQYNFIQKPAEYSTIESFLSRQRVGISSETLHGPFCAAIAAKYRSAASCPLRPAASPT
jgi:hypothetical protein